MNALKFNLYGSHVNTQIRLKRLWPIEIRLHSSLLGLAFLHRYHSTVFYEYGEGTAKPQIPV